ncbi:MAG TPA: SpoIID/LytB domain-containing protein [Gemmatimonadales bacterium]|nr:SpoIID/LytB domain-containing protein [Gemmatimonadales bacterium]
MAFARQALVAALLVAACARPEIARVTPAPLSPAPDIRVGVVVGGGSLTIGGGAPLVLATQQGGWVGEVPAAGTATVEADEGGLRVRLASGALSPGASLLIATTGGETRVRLDGRDYRGTLTLEFSRGRITAINVLDLEEYLLGVVGIEMGLRGETDVAALQAQAVVSRTIALQRLGRERDRGYDLLAGVADQAYAGVGHETELAGRAVLETRGQVLTYQGQVIDAFFHSTCAGRTAPGPEVFAAANRPYLRSISDLDEAGRPWCAISPRYRWREIWTGDDLARTLRQTVPAAGAAADLAASLRDVRVLERTGTGRVARLEIQGGTGSLSVTGPVARQVLRTADGSPLRSTDFTLQVTREGERIVRLIAEGAGAGHGVGMCQWGAIGRARAGFSYRSILSTYFPGTDLSRTY